ncbi:hypothetical protein [Aquipseudomonas alcaligenes]|uniref:hypothetical protein n=1 Tax=Aquipseudomonas alcaligenes TaxID=43263 RepID=UPI002430F268|nr:hypothetical protein [Pseudomonas alcaligenes]
MNAALRSELRFKDSHLPALLAALDYESDEDSSLEENVSDCLGDLGWYATGRKDDQLTFEFQSYDDEEMDWEALLTLSAFLEEGSYYEERCGDYVEDADGQPRAGVVRVWMESGQLKGMTYARIPGEDGQRIRQPVGPFDPRMI